MDSQKTIHNSIDKLLSGATRTLTAAEERDLFSHLKSKVAVVREVDRMKDRTHADLCRRWYAQKVADEVRGSIARANLPLVVKMAQRVSYKYVDFDDLVAEGTLTMMRCIDKFDVERGCKFSTYCCRALFKDFSGLSKRETKHQRNRLHGADEGVGSAEGEDIAAQVREVIDLELDPREAAVMRARRGIGHDRAMSVAAASDHLGMSKRGVVRMYASGMEKLERAFRERGFHFDDQS